MPKRVAAPAARDTCSAGTTRQGHALPPQTFLHTHTGASPQATAEQRRSATADEALRNRLVKSIAEAGPALGPLTAGPTYSEAGTGPTALHGVGLFCVRAGARPTVTAAEKAERRAEQHDAVPCRAVPCRAGSAGWAAWRARGSARQRRGLRTAKDGTVRHLERKLVLQRGTALWALDFGNPTRVLSRR